jgi:hypothetical protein
MTDIAAGWQKQDKNGELYISWLFKKDLLPLTITADKGYVSRANKYKTNDTPNAPDYIMESFIPDKNKAKKENSNG